MSASTTSLLMADTNIQVGKHITTKLFGMTFNVDTIWGTALAGLIVVGLGLWVARTASATNPSKVQLAWELIVSYVTNEVEGSLGRVNRYVVQLAIAIFTFILVCNWFELIPTGDDPHYLPSPTADVNLTYALGLMVIVGVHIHSFRQRGFRGYFAHYATPYKALLPLNIIEELVKPFTLALRLFGNIFAGGIMLAIIGLIPIWGFWGPNILWKGFDLFIGLIQAFIFGLLTIIYFGMAGESHGDHADTHDAAKEAHDRDDDSAGFSESETAQPELSGAH